MSYFKSLIFATAINFEVVGKNPNDIANKSARKNDALMNEKMRSLNVGEAGLVANKRFFVLRGVKVTGLKSAWIPIQRILLSANGTVTITIINYLCYKNSFNRNMINIKAYLAFCGPTLASS